VGTAHTGIKKDLEGLVEELRRKTEDRGVERVENDRTIIDTWRENINVTHSVLIM